MTMRCFKLALVALLVLTGTAASSKPPLVFAAASLQESLNAAARTWARQGHEPPVLSFAASSALARQIEAGAPADLFLSADEQWVDYVAARGFVRPGSRATLLSNRLVLIAPAQRRVAIRIARGAPLAQALGNGRLAIADPAAVPAGRYARAALQNLGLWPSIEHRLIPADNVRSALAFVERGEAPLGVVYATDALASRKVRVVGIFPATSHPRIRYPVALLKGGTSADAEPFRRFLLSPAGRAIFARFGFIAN